MRKFLLSALLCISLVFTSVPARSQAAVALEVGSSVASELGFSFVKSILGAFASNIFSKLFGTPTLSAEEAARLVKDHFLKMEMDWEKIKKEVLTTDVHDYIIERPYTSVENRRASLRQILYQTNALEARIMRLIENGKFWELIDDYIMVASTRLAFIAEQTYVEASITVDTPNGKVVQTDQAKMKEGHRILADQAHEIMRFFSAAMHSKYSDTQYVECYRKRPNSLFSGTGKPLSNTFIEPRVNGKDIRHDGRYKVCWQWLKRSAGFDKHLMDHYPNSILWTKPGKMVPNPIHSGQWMYRYKVNNDGDFALDVANSQDEARRQMVIRSMNFYPDKLGKPEQMIKEWHNTVTQFGNIDQKKSADFIYNWFMK